MPVDSKHAEYEHAAPKWKIMRDCLAGELAVKEAEAEYLPKLSGQTPEKYAAYRDRAQFFNGTDRTAQSMIGFVFRKNPEIKIPDSATRIASDFTLTGLTLYDYTRAIVSEVVQVGRAGTLIDFEGETEKRPYASMYSAESIINWRVERVRGVNALTMLVLEEESCEFVATEKDATPPDKFQGKTWENYRVYELMRDEAGGPYVQCTVYREIEKADGKKEFIAISSAVLTRRGIPLDAIPFVFHNSTNGLPNVQKIPLLDMALVNISLYRTSADLENGRHVAGTPTPWAAGFTDDSDEPLLLGADHAWTSTDPTAKCGFLEFTGAGLTSLEKAVADKKSEMAALGARMLNPEAQKAEAYETVAMRAAGETSALMSIAITCGQTLSEVLRWIVWWDGTAATRAEIADNAAIEINTEFVIATIPADLLTALFNAYLGGALDWESLVWKLKQGEVVPTDADPDQMRANILANPPGMAQPTTPPGGA